MSRVAVQSKGVSFRWLNGQCFEIKLPNGIFILTDPFLPSLTNQAGLSKAFAEACAIQRPFSVENLQGADYIILNHTHGDHIAQLQEIAERFHSRVIVQSAVAKELAETMSIRLTDIYPVDLNGTYYFDGFSLATFHGTHHPVKGNLPVERERFMEDFPRDVSCLSALGGLFNMNFIISTENCLRIGFAGGDIDNEFEMFSQYKPQIIFRNKLHSSASEYDVVGEWSDYLLKTKALLMVPMHHEKWLVAKPGYMEKVVEQMNQILKESGSPARVLNLVRTQWYSLNLSIAEEEEA